MTLLRRDKESKRELLGRLERVEKRRPADEVNAHYETLATALEEASGAQVADATLYAAALASESEIELADRHLATTKGLRRMAARRQVSAAVRRARRAAPETADEVAQRASARRAALLDQALHVLQVGLERKVAGANRGERKWSGISKRR